MRTAVWVVRDRLATRSGVEKTCREVSEAGLDSVLVQVRGRGDAYYDTSLVPRSESLKKEPASFDPLAQILEKCGKSEVVAWINAFFVWGGEKPPEDQAHVVNAHPDWILTDADGRPVTVMTKEERARGWIEGAYADPASEGYRAHFAGIAGELASKYGVGGIHLDFIRYPGPDYGRGGATGESFRAATGVDPRWLPTGFEAVDYQKYLSGGLGRSRNLIATAYLLFLDHRAGEVTRTVRAVRQAVDAAGKGVKLSAAVFPGAGAAAMEKGQDWRGWVREGLLDEVFPMTYFGRHERVAAELKEIGLDHPPAGRKALIYAGLGAWTKSDAEIGAESASARGMGFDGICLFDLESMSKKGSLKTYAKAIKGRKAGGDFPAREREFPKLTGALGSALTRASPSGVDLPGEELQKKADELEKDCRETLPASLAAVEKRLAATGVEAPEWRDMRGVFRYVNPLDPPEKEEEQHKICADVKNRAASGGDFAALVREYSQDGAKSVGGTLARRYLVPGEPEDDALLNVPVGGVSEVVRAKNGCWVYIVDKKGPKETLSWEAAPWDIKRKILPRELETELARAPETPAPESMPGGKEAK